MMEFLSENLATILISLVVVVLMGLAIYSMIRGKKNGKGCSGCSGCSHGSSSDKKHSDDSSHQCSGKCAH